MEDPLDPYLVVWLFAIVQLLSFDEAVETIVYLFSFEIDCSCLRIKFERRQKDLKYSPLKYRQIETFRRDR